MAAWVWFVMSSTIDNVLMQLSLHDVDLPFELPDEPEFCSSVDSRKSLIGRILNPACQCVANLVLDMPRKWQLVGKVRGVVLSAEKFQFIFQDERDLEEIIHKGVQTFNQWGLVLQRWMENPPPDYLQFVPVWVQLRNIPVHHKTVSSIKVLGSFAGQVLEVAFDPLRPQRKDYVRVRVKFDVSMPVRRVKVLNLPGGGQATILYDFEKFQKRCYCCQRLTHEQDICPLFLAKKEGKGLRSLDAEQEKKPFLMSEDPLFGVLLEDQVGRDPHTGRMRIAQDVLAGMRVYLLSPSGPDRVVKEERVKSSVRTILDDPSGQNSSLTLEQTPVITSELEKGKGIVFGYAKSGEDKLRESRGVSAGKLLSDAIDSGKGFNEAVHSDYPTGYRTSSLDAGSSGKSVLRSKPRNRPHMNRRKARASVVTDQTISPTNFLEVSKDLEGKRKAEGIIEGVIHETQRLKSMAVPKEGLSSLQ